jgi:hypothetical protein
VSFRKSAEYAFTVLYNPALTATKVSILMLYYRMSQARPFFRYSTLVVGAVVVLNGIVLTFLNLFQCRPVAAAFNDENFDTAKCIDILSLFLCSAPVNVITDIAILVLPLPMVTAMRLDIRQRVALIATFLTGMFVTVIDVVRIAYLQEALIQEGIQMTNKPSGGVGRITGSIPDFAWHASYSLMWSAIEVNVGLTCACALVIRPLLVRIVPGKSRRDSQMATRPDLSTTVNVPPWPPLVNGVDTNAPLEADSNEEERNGAFIATQSPPESPTLLQNNVDGSRTMFPVDEDREMDIMEFFATADGATNRAPATEKRGGRERRSTAGSILQSMGMRRASVVPPPQQEPTTFMDFVHLGDRKPLTELTNKEAWWPVAFGELGRRAWAKAI